MHDWKDPPKYQLFFSYIYAKAGKWIKNLASKNQCHNDTLISNYFHYFLSWGLFTACYRLNICVPSKFVCWNHKLQCDDICIKGLWELIRFRLDYEVGALMKLVPSEEV